MITEAQKLRAVTLTEEERNAYAVCLKYVLDVPASGVIPILESLAESRARERKLVAALETIGCQRGVGIDEVCREAEARGGDLQQSEWCVRCTTLA